MRRLADALQLLGLSALAVAQPLFEKLGPAPGYFAAHGIDGGALVLFALALVLVPAAAMVAAELLVGLAGEPPRRMLHLVFVAGLVALIALPALSGLATTAAYAVAALIGVVAAAAVAALPHVRSFVTALAVGPPLFLVAFLGFSASSELVSGGHELEAWGAEGSFRPSIVLLQFDAFPSLMLETRQRKIDAVRYPHLARLARDGTWYRNASNVHENTVFSVPSIVDGQIPQKGTAAVVQDHTPNLFTLLGPSYRMNVTEEAASLCPDEYCRSDEPRPLAERRENSSFWHDTRVVFNHIVRPERARASLPAIDDRWAGFGKDVPAEPTEFARHNKSAGYVLRHLRSGRVGRFEDWLAKIGRGDGRQPELDYIHAFFPHEPREYLPDGTRYEPDPVLAGPPSYDKRFLTLQDQMRDQLQIGFTDTLIGRVVGRLKRLGIYDDTMIVITSDHGESFDVKDTPAGPFVPGRLGFRRAVTERNIEDIASVPLFVKYPKGHGPTGIDDRFVRTVDVLPTIGGVLGLELPETAGHDLRDPSYGGHDEVEVETTYEGVVSMDVKRWQARRRVSLETRLERFGSGHRSLYRWGPNEDLMGKRVSSVETRPRGRGRITLAAPERLKDVNPRSSVCPCYLSGGASGLPDGVPLVVAVGGRIVAPSETFAPIGPDGKRWAALVPPKAFRRGDNRIEVFAVSDGRLTPLGGSG